jgi:hypothetical protein
MRCAQILSEALADGDQLGALACAGAAADHWGALSACVTASCSAVCPGIMPTNPCVHCIEALDADGGCATEIAGCVAN